MSGIEVRPACPEEAELLAALGRTTFVDTFVHEFGIPYPPADLAAHMEATFSAEATRAKLLDPTQIWWVAAIDGELVGFANAGPNTLPHPDARVSHAELRRLYVAKGAQGKGIGTRLLTTALAWMTAHTDGPLWLGVWSGNLKAQRLYAAYGFTKAGEYKYPVGTWYDDEFILRRG